VAWLAPSDGFTEIQQKRTCLQIPAQSHICLRTVKAMRTPLTRMMNGIGDRLIVSTRSIWCAEQA
jgi:hypothetical protein